MFKSRQFKALILMLGILVLTAFFFPTSTQAGFGYANSFGGRVVSKRICSCNNDAYIVTVQGSGTSSGTYLESSLARGYRHYFLNQGRFVLGNYTPGGQCLMAGSPCYPEPITKGTITMFGASF